MGKLRRGILTASLLIAAAALEGCVVFRTAGKVVGATVETTGKIIGNAADALR